MMAGKRSIVKPLLLYAGFVLLILNFSAIQGQETTNANEDNNESSTVPTGTTNANEDNNESSTIPTETTNANEDNNESSTVPTETTNANEDNNESSTVPAETTGATDDNTTDSSTDPKECAREFLDWCRGKDYSTFTGISVTVVSVYEEGKQFAVTCITTQSNGTDCTKNDESWFHCYPGGTLTYKDQPLTEETDDPAICNARDKAVSLIREVKQSLEDFQRTMREFIWYIGEIRRRMMNFHRSFFGRNFPFRLDYDGYNRYDGGGTAW